MSTLKEIISILRGLGITIAGITFVVLLLRIATNPEYKEKNIRLMQL